MTKQPLTLISAAEARRILAEAATPVATEAVSLAEAVGRVLAAPLLATEDVPAFSRAVMDGYAVRSEDARGAREESPVRLRVVGAVAMGERPTQAVGPGEALAIATGGHMPDGADAVVMVEHVRTAEGPWVDVWKPAEPGLHVIQAGEDLGVGSLVIPPGRRLRPQDIAGLATFGITSVRVFRRPRVAVLSTGVEICALEERPTAAKVRDVNQPALAAQAVLAGARVTRAGIAPDDPAALEAAIAGLLPHHDLVMLSGGSSIGGKDFTGQVMHALGADILFHGINVRPGKPTLVARKGAVVVVGLPGVPTSALVIFDVFVRPLIWRLGGEVGRQSWPARREARLGRPHVSARGREEYLRVRLEQRDGQRWAEPLPGGSAALSSLLGADGLVIVPEEVEGIEAGGRVEVCLF
jgi:molybdopterin molybdotransferase